MVVLTWFGKGCFGILLCKTWCLFISNIMKGMLMHLQNQTKIYCSVDYFSTFNFKKCFISKFEFFVTSLRGFLKYLLEPLQVHRSLLDKWMAWLLGKFDPDGRDIRSYLALAKPLFRTTKVET